jgi:tetratricopeptide (TPR) repeat protein
MAGVGVLLGVSALRLAGGIAAPTAPREQALQGEIARLQAAVRRGPYDEALHYQLGQLMLEHDAPEALLDFFSEERARDQKPQTSLYFMAMAYARQGKHQAAVSELGRALDIDPAHELSQRAWGLLLEQQGQLTGALDHLLEATRIHPEFRPALEDAARVADRLGRQPEAARLRQRALTADPSTPRRFLYWARYLHQRGRNEAALSELARRLQEAPGDPEALALRTEITAGDEARPRE